VGYEARDFVSGASASSQTPAVNIALTYLQNVKRSITLSYNRATGVSPNFMSQLRVTDSVKLAVNQGLGEGGRWMIGGSAMFSNRDMAKERISGAPSPYSLARTDTSYGLSLGLYYKPQNWITCSLAYGFDSYSISAEDPRLLQVFPYTSYHVNHVSLSASIGF
jgi:hypothetical protein